MKVLAINGSPRRGNTEAMLKRVLDGAKEKEAQIELVNLRELKIEHCGGCLKCEETGVCHKTDEMMPLYGKLIEADAIVFGSPNYFNNVSGIMKDFIDRTNPLYSKSRLKAKKAGIVVVGSAPEKKSIEDCLDVLKTFCEIHKMKLVGEVKAKAEKAGEIAENEEKMQECFELGQKLAKR